MTAYHRQTRNDNLSRGGHVGRSDNLNSGVKPIHCETAPGLLEALASPIWALGIVFALCSIHLQSPVN